MNITISNKTYSVSTKVYKYLLRLQRLVQFESLLDKVNMYKLNEKSKWFDSLKDIDETVKEYKKDLERKVINFKLSRMNK